MGLDAHVCRRTDNTVVCTRYLYFSCFFKHIQESLARRFIHSFRVGRLAVVGMLLKPTRAPRGENRHILGSSQPLSSLIGLWRKTI